MTAAEESSLHAYIALSLFTGVRPEEARALRWDHIDVESEPPTVAIWRSARQHGDTKTEASRRTLSLTTPVVAALKQRRVQQERDRLEAAPLWGGLRPSVHYVNRNPT